MAINSSASGSGFSKTSKPAEASLVRSILAVLIERSYELYVIIIFFFIRIAPVSNLDIAMEN